MSVKLIVKSIGENLSKHSPQILTGIGVAGLVSTAVLAVKATPKAVEILNEQRLIRADEDEDFVYGDHENCKLPPKEIVELTWKLYIPAIVTGAVSIACIIGATTIQNRRAAALASVYSLSELALKEYQEKVRETIGEGKELKIRDEIVKDRIERDPVAGKEVILTSRGEHLCFDTMSSRYFRSNLESVRRSVNDLNEQLLNETFVSLNEFYDYLGISHTKLGGDMGWSLESGKLEMHYTGQLAENGEPCMCLDYRVVPHFFGY